MQRSFYILAITVLTFACAGCANRCNRPCGNWLAGNTRIAPPPTYSLNIPSVAQNQPYYTPNGPISTTAQAPSPANVDNRWRPTTTDGANTQQNQPTTSPQNRFADASFGQSVLSQVDSPAVRPTSYPANGLSITSSPNFRSTQIDERQDASRVPVTDASGVRAPSQNLVSGYGVSQTYAQNYYQPRAYSATGIVVQPASRPLAYSGQPVIVSNGPSYGMSANAAAQPGWRASELGSDRLR